MPSTFTELFTNYHAFESTKFDPMSEHGFLGKAHPERHNGFKGSDCTEQFDECGAITCQGLYENNFEPVFLCLANESLTRHEIQEVATEFVIFVKKQLEMPDSHYGRRFKTSDYRIGTESLTAQLEAKFAAKLRGHRALRELIDLSGTTNPKFQSVKDKILQNQDQIVWLGKNSGIFDGHKDSVKAKQLIIAYLANVGVYSERTIKPLTSRASGTDILGQTKILFAIDKRFGRGRLYSAFQPNFCSKGDPLLWVGRPQRVGGRAIKLVNKSHCHNPDHRTCDCGAPAEFEAIASLKNIRWSKSRYQLLKVCVFGHGELNEYERPPLNAIRSKN